MNIDEIANGIDQQFARAALFQHHLTTLRRRGLSGRAVGLLADGDLANYAAELCAQTAPYPAMNPLRHAWLALRVRLGATDPRKVHGQRVESLITNINSAAKANR